MDGESCAQKLPTLVEHLVINFASENNEVTQTTHDALSALVQHCITKKMIEQVCFIIIFYISFLYVYIFFFEWAKNYI